MKEVTQFSHLTLCGRIKIQIGLETGQTILKNATATKFSRQKIHREILNNRLIKKNTLNPLRRDCLTVLRVIYM